MASQKETFDIFTSVFDIVNQIAEYALNTVTVFFIVFINAYHFGISIWMYMYINLLDDPPLKTFFRIPVLRKNNLIPT